MGNERNWRPNDRNDRNDREDRDRDDHWDQGQGQSGYGAGRHEGDRSWRSREDYGHPGHWTDERGGGYLGQGGQQMGYRDQGGMYGEGHYQQGMYGRGGQQDRYGSQGYQGWSDNDQPHNTMQHARWPSRNDRAANQSWSPGTNGMSYGNQHEHDMPFRGGQQPMQSHRGKGPQGYVRSDERIRESVCEVLTDDHHVDASGIEVTVKNGEVVLSGTVDDRMQKRRAEDIVENLTGVRDVVNQLRIVTQVSGTESSRSASAVDVSPREQAQQGSGNGANDKRHRA
jgi:osmotically-inducible protein OsmY